MLPVLFLFWLLLICNCFGHYTSSFPTSTPTEPPYDGIIREANGEDGRLEAILKPAYAMNHCSQLHFIPQTNELSLGWFSGCAEGANDTSDIIAKINMKDTQINGVWSDPNVIAQDTSYSDQNPMFFTDPLTGILHLFYPRQHVQVPPNQNESQIFHKYSYNGTGDLFQNETILFPQYGSFVRHPMITKLDGTWLLPMYYGGSCIHGGGSNNSNNTASHYGSWFGSRSGYNADGKYVGICSCGDYPYIMMNDDQNINGKWRKIMWGTLNQTACLVQPTVVRLKKNEPNLLTFFRDRRHQWIYSSISDDDGETWTVPKPIDIHNNNAAIQAFTLKNDNIALVCNPQNYTYPRDPLIIALSTDQGKTFPYKRYLENHFVCYNDTLKNCTQQNQTYINQQKEDSLYYIDGVNDVPPIPNCTFYPNGPDRYAYPSVIQVPGDNRIHVAYTWQRRAIKYSIVTEEWVKKGNVTLNQIIWE